VTTVLKNDDEEGRLRALDRLAILDTTAEAPFDKIVNLVRQVLHVPMCAVSLVDRNRQWFKAQCGLGVGETARDISFCTHAIGGPAPFIVRNAVDDPRFSGNPLVIGTPFIRSYAGIPLSTRDGYNIGTLCAIDTKPRDFPDSEIAILENFAKVVVDELELRQIASSDHMTGALSRRAWTDAAQMEINRASRYGRPLSLAILDIDKFKVINDTYGHPAGDIVIKRLAALCMASIRESDLFGRFGGEEFALLMPETNLGDAERAIERIRTAFAGEPIDTGCSIGATVSIGLALLDVGETDVSALIDRADKALYQAKNAGRNCTVVAWPGEPAIRQQIA
jgi:diguanylate cyclase (GGDEF)-like protein